MKKFTFFAFLFFATTIHASVLKIATGEYGPFSGEFIEHQGTSTQLVRAIFKDMKQEIELEFMPWNRVMNNVENESVAGSFPWNMNDERLKKNYFSLPIDQYRIFAFTRTGSDFNTEKSLKGKWLCLPNGWDVSPYSKMIQKLNLKVESPMSIESCFHMLAMNRVDIIFMNELVGREVNHRLFGKNSLIIASEKKYFQRKNNLYFIVSKDYPNAKKIITTFNLGLERIKDRGVYRPMAKTKSTCGICNRLGSL